MEETKTFREMLERVMKNTGSVYTIDSKNLQLGDKIPDIITHESPQVWGELLLFFISQILFLFSFQVYY